MTIYYYFYYNINECNLTDSIGFEQAAYTANEADGSVEVCAILQGSNPETPVQVSLSTVYIPGEAAGISYFKSYIANQLLYFCEIYPCVLFISGLQTH